MRKTMLLTLAAASLAAGPALALPPHCTGDACAVVAPVPASLGGECWAIRNASDRTVRGMIVGVKSLVFTIPPGGVTAPYAISGACLKGGGAYLMKYDTAPPKAGKVKPR